MLNLFSTFIFMSCAHATQDVSFKNDWKLVTIFTGGKDLCEYCTEQVSLIFNKIYIFLFREPNEIHFCVSLQNNLSPKNYSHSLMLTLDMLFAEVRK